MNSSAAFRATCFGTYQIELLLEENSIEVFTVSQSSHRADKARSCTLLVVDRTQMLARQGNTTLDATDRAKPRSHQEMSRAPQHQDLAFQRRGPFD